MSEGSKNWCYRPVKSWDFLTYLQFVTVFFLDFLIQMYALFTHGSLAQELLAAWGRRGQWGSCNWHFAWEFCCTKSWSNYHQLSTLRYHFHIFITFRFASVWMILVQLRPWLNRLFFHQKNEALKGLGVGWSSRQPPKIFPWISVSVPQCPGTFAPKASKRCPIKDPWHPWGEGQVLSLYLFI